VRDLNGFTSSKYTESLMGEARKGVAVWAPDPTVRAWAFSFPLRYDPLRLTNQV
jgi:hypothetical protein